MKAKKTIILFILILLYSQLLFAQSIYEDIGQNSQKYWYYRDRLKYFMLGVGDNPGHSLIFTDRLGDYNYTLSRLIVADDAPNELGFYIGVLATELKLLTDEGAATENTEKELFYALEALNRLDLANVCINGNCSNNTVLDGILARDDFPANATFTNPLPNNGILPPLNYHKNVNYVDHTNAVSVSGVPAGQNGTGCTDDAIQLWMTNHGYTQNTIDNPICQMMSQDHYIRILMGLCLVTKMVNPSAHYSSPCKRGNINFDDEARAIANRIVTHFQNNYWLLYQPGKSPGIGMDITMTLAMASSWVGAGIGSLPTMAYAALFYTSADLCQSINWGEYNKLVYRGNTAMKYAYGWAKAAEFTTGSSTFLDAFSASPDAILLWKAYTQYSPSNLHFLTYNIQNEILLHSSGNISQILTLAAIGDSWHQLWGTDVTEDHIKAIDADFGYNWKLYSLLWAVLHNQTTSFSQAEIENLLNLAPCEGPAKYDPNGWCNRNRFTYNAAEDFEPQSNKARNGLDYMLLYNLYYIKFRSSLPSYSMSWLTPENCNVFYSSTIEKLTPSSLEIYPKNAPAIGTNNWSQIGTLANPLYMRSETFIEDSWTQINAGAHVEYRAGFDIHLYSAPVGNFFHATSGCEFHAVPNVASDCDANGSYSYNTQRVISPAPANEVKPALNPTYEFNFDAIIFPNPVSDYLNVTYTFLKDSPLKIIISDIQGKVIYTKVCDAQQSSARVEIPVSEYENGVYTMQIESANATLIKKVVVAH